MTEKQLQILLQEIYHLIERLKLDEVFQRLRTNAHVFQEYRFLEEKYLYDYIDLPISKQVNFHKVLKCFVNKTSQEYIEAQKFQTQTWLHNLQTEYKTLQNQINHTKMLNSLPFDMIFIEGGSIKLENVGVIARYTSSPLNFDLPNFYLSETLVTQELWNMVMANRTTLVPVSSKNMPVSKVSKQQASLFCTILSDLLGETFCLPTEAQWEYAALGGLYAQAHDYAGSNMPQEVAWTQADRLSNAQPVKKRNPNPLGLYDMSGNLWEWCENADHAENANTRSPKCILRGGAWDSPAYYAQVKKRLVVGSTDGDHSRGFRICKNI